MARPNARQYIAALFAPFVEAAGDPPWASRLTTAVLPEDRLVNQYRRLARLEELGGAPLPLISDRFIYRFRHHEGAFLCVSVEGLTSESMELLRNWAAEQELTEVDLEEAAFLFLAHAAATQFRPKSANLTREGALQLIAVVDQDYSGHSIYDVMGWYQDVAVFEMPEDNINRNLAGHAVAGSLAASVADFRSRLISPNLADSIGKILALTNVNPENIYFALTTSHWKYVVVELYKCLEAAFYLPWIKTLRDAIGHDMSALEMAQKCKQSLQWREKEKDSLIALFSMLPEVVVVSQDVLATEAFVELGAVATSTAMATRIYRVRNQIVHQYDYDSPEPLRFRQGDWEVLAVYISDIVFSLYSTYAVDLDYAFAIDA
jgi:hypothetical protein